MRSAWFRRLGLAAVAGWLSIAGAGMTGCASTRGEINRVQANAVRKADLVGDNYRDATLAPEWYMRDLVIGVQRTNPWFSDGLQGQLKRVRFEIQENYLIVRDAYEYVIGADGHGGVKGKTNNGPIVAMFPITSHFDEKRSYNPSTGEDTNILEENTTDRRWYERDFIRVDWSQNVVNDPNFFETWYPKAFGEMKMQPVQFFEQDPTRPDAPNFNEMSTGYFDYTSKWLMQPRSVDYYGFSIPQCLLSNLELNGGMHGDGSIECNDQEVQVRTSFMKVPTGDAATDPEVVETDGQQESIVGGFFNERFSYDRQYGIVDATWHKQLIRYNIWQKSHDGRECGADNVKSTADAFCSTGNTNSTCDMYWGKCTLPIEKRALKPIAFFADPALPTALLPATGEAVGEWNKALMAAVANGREAECRRASSVATPRDFAAESNDRDTCHKKYFEAHNDPANPDVPLATQGPVAVFCHNPVVDGDSPACGTVGTAVRKGDIRHHMIAWWSNPAFEAPLGVVVLGADPTTGEHINSMTNIFGDGMESAISIYRDWIQLANGDVSPTEYVDAVPEQLYGTGTSVYPSDPHRDPALDSLATTFKSGKPYGAEWTNKELEERLKGINAIGTAQRIGLVDSLKGATTVEEKLARMQAFWQTQGKLGTPGFGGVAEFSAKASSQIGKLEKSGLETQAVSGQYASGFGIDPANASNPTVVQAISPLGALNPAVRQAVQAEWDKHWGSHAACKFPGVSPLSFGHFDGIAAKYKARYKDGATATGKFAKMAGVEGKTIDRQVRGKLIYWEMFETVYKTIVLHEMGHNMDEDHDFGASWDSVNYYPEYWQLRTANGAAAKACPSDKPRSKAAPDNCMGPRYLDPESSEELGTTPGNEHDQISSYSVSSVMDYHEDSRYWPGGLGQYDKMAAGYIYGGVVEVYDDTAKSLIPNVAKVSDNLKGTMESQLGGDWYYKFASGVGNFSQPTHYTQVGRLLNLFDPLRCRAATAEEDANGVAQYHQVCAPVQRDHALVRDMVTEDVKDGQQNLHLGYWRERPGLGGGASQRIRWPYKYGPSRFANYPHIATFDQGADMYEVTTDIINWHELHNAMGMYRAGRREWNPENLRYSLYRSYYARIHLLAWDQINSAVRYASFFPDNGIADNPIAKSDDWGRGNQISMTMLFDLLQRELLRPQPGGYGGPVTLPGQAHALYGVPVSPDASFKPDFQLGALDSAYIDNEYDSRKGYEFKGYVSRIGSYVEKPLAALMLVDSIPPLSTVSRDTYLDGRNVMFSFRSSMPDAFDRLLAGSFADDWDSVASYVVPSEKDASGMSPLHPLQLWQFDGSDIKRPAGAKVVDPMLGYEAKSFSMLLTLLYEPIDSNMELVNRTRIWVEGASEGVKVAPEAKVVFYDPVEGLTWGATKFGTETLDGKTVQIGIGARMLQHANELLVAAYNVKVGADGLPVYGADGRPVIDPSSTETSLQVKNAGAAAKLRLHVGFLNNTRNLLYYLGFGPLRGGGE